MVQGDTGVQYQIPTIDRRGNPFNITGATSCQMIITAPSGVKQTVAAVVGTAALTALTSADGNAYAAGYYAYRTTLASDFSEYGNYSTQLLVTLATGEVIRSKPMTFVVDPAL